MADFFRSMVSGFGGMLGLIEHKKLEIYAKHGVKTQEHNLKKLMRTNKSTEYGKKCNFKDVKSVKDYQDIVPLSTYDDYADYIDRMVQGEKNLITTWHIGRYAESSGSVGKPKYIPQSARQLWNCQCFSFSAPVGCAVKYFRSKGKKLPPQKGLLTIEITSHKLPCGKTVSCLSGIPLMYLKPIVPYISTSPKEVLFPKDPSKMNMHYLKMRYGLENRNVSYLSTIIVTVLETMFRYLEENWEMFVDDIEKGKIDPSIELPPELRAKLEKRMKPNPKRAAELRKEFEKGFDTPIAPRIWPKLGWAFGMGASSLSIYSKRLRRYTGDLPMHNLGYGASEALMAVPLSLDTDDCVMLPQNGFFEFLPVDAPEGTRPLTMNQLEPGKDYEVIVTNLSGLYRYRIEDVVRCTGYYYESPTVTFMYRLNQVVNIAGEKTSQQMLDWSVAKMAEEFGINVTGHSIYADLSTSPGHYVLFVEPGEPVSSDKCEAMAKAFDKYLSDSNLFISDAKNTGTLGDTEMHFLRQGTYEEQREALKKRGANLNQIKPLRVIKEDKKDFFFSHIAE